jgi:integrase
MLEVESVIDKRLTGIVGLKDKMLARRKREVGLVSNESDRGQIIQIVKADGIEVAESRKLDYHIDKYLEARERDCALKKIAPGRLKKIGCALDSYKNWSPIISGGVDRIGTKEHIESYHSFLAKRVLAIEIKPKYANDLFGEFKTLINWLVKEEVLKEFPRCLQLKGNGYRFVVKRQKPITVPLEWVHRILDAASPRLRLCIMLTLNCGFGASEIGKLEKDEYDPATGRITHKRYKTEKSDSTPTVCYKLWQETKELLDQEIENRKKYPKLSGSAKYLLVNTNGKPLWNESVDTGKSDNISSAFKRLIVKLRKTDSEMPPVAYYQFRKTSATLIFNQPEFTRLDWLWLGHAPNTMAGQSYSAAENEILDRCIAWLHDRIFDTESSSEGREDVNIGNV